MPSITGEEKLYLVVSTYRQYEVLACSGGQSRSTEYSCKLNDFRATVLPLVISIS